MIFVVVPARYMGPCDRLLLAARFLGRPGRAMTGVMSFDCDRRKRGGDAKSDEAPF
jgi:hypothetical protein